MREGVVRLRQWEETIRGGMGWSWDKTVPLGDGLPEEEEVARPGDAVRTRDEICN
jgi:hypothetical protein